LNTPTFRDAEKEDMEMAEEQLACPLTKGERILVAVDGSIYSEIALDQAISMATVCGSQLFAIHVVEAYPKHLESICTRL
jgi:K+-sensing histidine kinase KdpD